MCHCLIVKCGGTYKQQNHKNNRSRKVDKNNFYSLLGNSASFGDQISEIERGKLFFIINIIFRLLLFFENFVIKFNQEKAPNQIN